MNISYEVKDIVKVLIKKWYVIIVCIIICVACSIPVAKKSYADAVRNYEKYVTDQGAEEVKIDKISTYINIIRGEDDSNSKIQDIASDIISISQDVIIENKLIITMKYYKSIDSIYVYAENIKEEQFNTFIDSLNEKLEKELLPKLGNKVEYEDISIEYNDENLAETLLKEPTEMGTGLTAFIKAGIFGFLLGVFAILVYDYCKIARQIRREERNEN